MKFTCIGRTHGAPAVSVTREEWERLRNEPWLAEMCRRIEAGEEALKHRLPIWTPIVPNSVTTIAPSRTP